jgi:dihydroxyacetone kinase-like protein
MSWFYNKNGLSVVLDMIDIIKKNREYLSEIDGAIGDGDHGINMNKGFSMAGDKLAPGDADLTGALKVLGRTLLGDIGGSMGPLYGTFFLKMSRTLGAEEKVDAQLFGRMLDAALEGIRELGDAKVGDKTLIDTLEPAQAAYSQAVAEGRDFGEALAAMKSAAERGWLSTKDLVAKIGRASRLGERSRGVLDAGATSCWLILASMADSINRLLQR